MDLLTRFSTSRYIVLSKHSHLFRSVSYALVSHIQIDDNCPRHVLGRRMQRRRAHSRRHVSSASLQLPGTTKSETPSTEVKMPSKTAPLSCLPLSTLFRSYLITSVSSMPFLLRPSLGVLSFLAHAKSPLLNPDRNPLLKYVLKKTFYAQFCAGEKTTEINETIAQLKTMGYAGVILGYAREVVLEGDDALALDVSKDCGEQERCNTEEIETWSRGNIETVKLTEEGDFVALKFTGAGRQALQSLMEGRKCAPKLEEAIHQLCRLSKERGVKLLFDAEQAAVQKTIDGWTMYFMRQYNKDGTALVYGTYQAYLRSTPDTLAQHLDQAWKGGYALGVKLVRGAYLGSDPRDRIWGSIEETHKAYDGIAEALLRRRWNAILKGKGEMPQVDLVLASHNKETVRKARMIRDGQVKAGEQRIDLAYGQLMGMADNVSCELVQAAKNGRTFTNEKQVDIPRAFKYLVWGSVGECSKYLLRRAQENRDAVSRTVDGRKALGSELARRLGLSR